MKPLERKQGRKLLATVALELAIALQLVLIFMLITLGQDVRSQRNELATKEDLKQLAMNMGPANPAMDILRRNCASCHKEAEFIEEGVAEEVSEVIGRMQGYVDSQICPQNVPALEAALTFLKCSGCHRSERVKEMVILDRSERWKTIVRMMKKPDSAISLEDARRIHDYYGEDWSWDIR